MKEEEEEEKPYSQDPPKTLLIGATKAFPRRVPMPFAPLLIAAPIVEKGQITVKSRNAATSTL